MRDVDGFGSGFMARDGGRRSSCLQQLSTDGEEGGTVLATSGGGGLPRRRVPAVIGAGVPGRRRSTVVSRWTQVFTPTCRPRCGWSGTDVTTWFSTVPGALVDGFLTTPAHRVGAAHRPGGGPRPPASRERRSVLGIHSPSRVFAEIGLHTAQAWRRASPPARPTWSSAMALVVTPGAAAPAAPPPPASPQAGSRSPSCSTAAATPRASWTTPRTGSRALRQPLRARRASRRDDGRPPFDGDAWDRIAFRAGAVLGRRPRGGARPQAQDRHAPAVPTAHVASKRRELAELTITLVGWGPPTSREMERLTELVFPNEATARNHAPVGVTHPALQFHDVNVIFVHGWRARGQDNGTFELTLNGAGGGRRPPRPQRAAAADADRAARHGVHRRRAARPAAPAAAASPRRRT